MVFAKLYSCSLIFYWWLIDICRLLLIFLIRNMTESPKKRKQNPEPAATVTNRGIINANWQKLLQIMDQQPVKPSIEHPKQQFTGTFRKNRKKNNNKTNLNNEPSVENNLKTLTLSKNRPENIINKTVDFPDEKPNNKLNISDLKTQKSNGNQTNGKKLTKFIAMDCEMVGIGFNGEDHMLARVSLVNKFGDCIYDKFVKAREEVKDYRTGVSGIRKEDMLNGEEFSTVQKEVADLLKGRVLIGHSLKNDLAVLFLSHPKRSIRDTSKYKPFKKITKGSTPSLKRLSKEILGLDIQHGEHSSIEDARAAMHLYLTVANVWEKDMAQKRSR